MSKVSSILRRHSFQPFIQMGNPDRNVAVYFAIASAILYLPRLGMFDPSLFIALAGIFHLIRGTSRTFRGGIWLDGWIAPVFFSFALALLCFGAHIYASEFLSVNFNAYYFFRIFRSILIFGFFFLLLARFPITETKLLKATILAFSIHTAFAYLQLVPIQPVRELARAANLMGNVNFSYRTAGLAVGYDLAGILIGINVLNIWALRKERGRLDFWMGIALLLHLAALLFTSRTGMMLAGFCVIFFEIFYSKHVLSNILSLFKLGMAALFASLLSIGVIFLVDQNTAKSIFQMAFEIPINMLNGEGIRTESSDDTFKNHYFFILKNQNIWQGFPEAVFNKTYGFFTDVGIVQILNGHGIFGILGLAQLLMMLLLFLICGEFQAKNIQKISLSLLVGFILINFKGPYFFSRQAFDLILIYIAYLMAERLPSNLAKDSSNL